MAETIYDFFIEATAKFPDRSALVYRVQGMDVGITYRELSDAVNTVSNKMRSLGLSKGDSIGILSSNRPEWVIADLAAMKLGCIVVPIYPTLSASAVIYIINDSGMKLLFVESEELRHLVENAKSELGQLKHIITFGRAALNDWIGLDNSNSDNTSDSPSKTFEETVSRDDPATIVYTSGTTGEPKGVILTHHNVVSNVISVTKRFQLTFEDIIVSYLPLSHMLERTCGYYAFLFVGATVAYAENVSTIGKDVARIRPTILLAVPRVIEKAYEQSVKAFEGSSLPKRFLIHSAIHSLNSYANLIHKNSKVSFLLRLKVLFYNRYVASKFRNIAGGRLRVVASGGAPLDKKIAKLFHIMGLNIVEGYGLTETSPIVSCHTLTDKKLGTVGKPLDGVEVQIGENDEILVKGPNLMKGYLNKPHETAMVIDQAGWFHTGDQGRFDADGNLIITGRIKELIVTSNGKKIAPAAIESRLARCACVSQAVIYGDNRKYVVALIVPDREAVERLAMTESVFADSYPSLLTRREILDFMSKEIDAVSLELSLHERVKNFTLIREEFTIENGLLTPTLKVRRQEIELRYAGLIDEMYDSSRV